MSAENWIPAAVRRAAIDRKLKAGEVLFRMMTAELGLTHEALYRTLAGLERSGEIRRKGGKITLSKGV